MNEWERTYLCEGFYSINAVINGTLHVVKNIVRGTSDDNGSNGRLFFFYSDKKMIKRYSRAPLFNVSKLLFLTKDNSTAPPELLYN